MSSVVISGDVSGSVTLQAPSTAGTTVLTLPATSGTVVTTATSTGISGSAITTGTVGVSVGGTGANTLTANNVILGNGTSAVQFVAPGSNGNVLTSNGTTWTSAAASGGQLQTQIFSAPGTWTKPSSATQVKVTVIGGGGGGAGATSGDGGAGGAVIATVPVSAPVSITVGSGGNGLSSGGSSSFGPAVSATGGGGGGPGPVPGTPGTGTVSTGTLLKNTASNTGVPGNVSYNNGSIINTTLVTGQGQGINNYNPSTSAIAYSPTSYYAAGAGGRGTPVVECGGIGGAVIVEFVG